MFADDDLIYSYTRAQALADGVLVFEIDTRRGLIHARDPDGHVFRWTRALWRRDGIERIE